MESNIEVPLLSAQRGNVRLVIKKVNSFLSYIAAMFFTAMVVVGATRLMQVQEELRIATLTPVTFHSSEIQVPVASSGDVVPFKVVRDVNYACESADVLEVWRRENSPTYREFGRRPTFGDMSEAINSKGFEATIKIPRLPEGRWCYQPKVEYHCSGRGNITVQQTPACTTIVKRKKP